MSETEQFAEHGRWLAEFIKAKTELATIRSRNELVAGLLRDVAGALTGGTLGADFAIDTACDAQMVRGRLADLHQAQVRYDNFRSKLESLGVKIE